MKFIKFVFTFIILSILVSLLGVVIFLKTFDLNRYLPQITQSVSDSIKRDVRVAKGDLNISLKGIVLDMGMITIGDIDPKADPVLLMDSAHASVEFMPLLTKGKLQISSIEFAGIKVNVNSPDAPIHADVRNIKANIKDFVLDHPFPVTVDVTFASDAPNIHMTGNATIVASKSRLVLTDVLVTSDLSQVKMDEIRSITPALAEAPLPSKLSGELKIDAASVGIGAKGLEELNARIELNNGTVILKEILSPLTAIHIVAKADMDSIDVGECALNVGEGNVSVQAKISDYLKSQQFTANVNIDRIKIQDLIDQGQAPVVVKGKASGSVTLSGQGFTPELLSKSLTGQGQVVVKEGVIEKLNIIKSVLGSVLGKIPGLAEGVDSIITGEFKEKLGGDSTVVDKAESKFTIAGGIVNLDLVNLSTKAFEVYAKGTVGFDMESNIAIDVLVDRELSKDLADKVSQLAYLNNENEQIKLSGRINGPLMGPSFTPSVDMARVGANAIVSEGMNQLDKAIEKNPELAPAKELINGVLNNIFK